MKKETLIDEIKNMKFSRLMGAMTFITFEAMTLAAFFMIETRDIISLMGIKFGELTLIWSAIFGKKILDSKNGGGGNV